jgi:hypothetical protein
MKQVRATSSYFRVCLINVAAQPESGIHVTLDPTDHGHDPGQIGLSEFRLDPLAEVKKVKTPLVGRIRWIHLLSSLLRMLITVLGTNNGKVIYMTDSKTE